MKQKLFLLSELLRRDLRARYAGSFGGPFWALLNPLILCLLYGFVFAVVIQLPPPPGFGGSYVAFLLGGLLPWIGFSEAVGRATASVTDQAHLVKKLHFPVELVVLSSLASAFLFELVAVSLLALWEAAAGGHGVKPHLLVAAFLFEALLLLGPALILAALNVFFRDLTQLVSPLLMIAFYLTPILYPESLVPARFARLLVWNPLRDLVALFRAGLFGSPSPPVGRCVLWAALSAVVAFAGARFFRRCRTSFSDLL